VIGNFFMAFVFSHNIAVWDPRTWGFNEPMMPPTMAALNAGVFTWLGFYMPVDLNTVAWEGRSWKLFFINTGYHLVAALVAAMILVHMR
jgi:hypothetical protein